MSAICLTLARSRGEPGRGRTASVQTGVVASLTRKIRGGRSPRGSFAHIRSRAAETSTSAESRLFSYSNSTETTATSSREEDLTFRTRSRVASSFSTGRATLSSTSPAEAPGQTSTTAIFG
nr:hypothetical protein [Thermosulfurimonas sp. F29]